MNKKRCWGAYYPSGTGRTNVEGEEEEENEEENVPAILVVKPCTSRRKTFEPLKGKCVALSPEKLKKKSMPKIDEVSQGRKKFLDDTTIAAKKEKVLFEFTCI